MNAREQAAEPLRLDLFGLKCPLPVLRARKALRRLNQGQILIVLSDDPLAAIDLPHMAATDGHALEAREPHCEGWAFTIRRGSIERKEDLPDD